MSEETDNKELVIYLNKSLDNFREVAKYLITIAIAIIPLLLGVIGFLLKDIDLPDWGISLFFAGLILIFTSILVNIIVYIPAFKAMDKDHITFLWEQLKEIRRLIIITAAILCVGMMLVFTVLSIMLMLY